MLTSHQVKLPDNEYEKLLKRTEELKEKLSSLSVKIYKLVLTILVNDGTCIRIGNLGERRESQLVLLSECLYVPQCAKFPRHLYFVEWPLKHFVA